MKYDLVVYATNGNDEINALDDAYAGKTVKLYGLGGTIHFGTPITLMGVMGMISYLMGPETTSSMVAEAMTLYMTLRKRPCSYWERQ